MPVAQRLRWGRTQFDPLILGEALPKIHTMGLPYPPKIQTVGHPPFPIPQPNSTSGAQNQTMGNWPLRGQNGGVIFEPPHFGPMGKWPQIQKNVGGAILGTPHFGPLGVTSPFLQFWTPEHQRNTWTNLTPTDTQPIARKPTYFWAKPKLNLFFSFPIPHTGGNLHKGDPTYGSRVIHIIYTMGTDPPHRGGVRPPSSPLHHEAKEQVQFCSTPR